MACYNGQSDRYFLNMDNHIINPLKNITKKISIDQWLFVGAIISYLIVHFVGLTKFPIFFFTDEAIQTIAATDLIHNNFRDPSGIFLPTYFENGGQYNLSLSVYLQVIPSLLSNNSIWITRGVSVLISLIGGIFSSLILKDFLKNKIWWITPLILCLIPAWFYHSRTAFETIIMASSYAGFIFYYLLYRNKRINAIYLTFLFGAFSFYAYSPGQIIIVITGLLLLIFDFHYHWQQKRKVLPALLFLMLLILPYLRFRLVHQEALVSHLKLLNSYWISDIPLYQKFLKYFSIYLKGLNPLYWFIPNETDLIRHRMKEMGHIFIVSFPFFIIGLIKIIKKLRHSTQRTILIALLSTPTGAALVNVSITRLFSFLIPATLLITMGLDYLINLIPDKKIKPFILKTALFIIVALLCFGLLFISLDRGPLWFTNYGLYGMQYGGQDLFDEIESYLLANPQQSVILSPSWANGTDVIARYFLGTPLPIKLGTIYEYDLNFQDLDRLITFIALPEEYSFILNSEKFTDIKVERKIQCPNGDDCFYFLTMAYVPEIEEIFDAQILERRKLQESTISINGIPARIKYSLLDINQIDQAFDNDPNTLIRTFESNPLIINLLFDKLISFNHIMFTLGGTPTRLEVKISGTDSSIDQHCHKEVDASNEIRIITCSFQKTIETTQVSIEILNLYDSETAHVHLWDVHFE